MKARQELSELKAGGGLFAVMVALVMVLAVTAILVSPPAEAGHRHYKFPKISDALEANGFATLKFALDTTGLTPVLDSNHATVFAPTDDVFEATAQALGCTDALDLATRLIDIPVGDSNALAAVLSHHAVLGTIRSKYKLLRSSPIQTVNGDAVSTGVNSEGLYVQGAANDNPASITVEGIGGFRWVIYPIDAILLPFAPPADLCS
ncbi:MAG: fasciclin domain-containing protein [Gammaproteobacteria bacterium]